MKKLFLVALSLVLALSLACCAVLAEDADIVERFKLPEPQDLATLFPNDTIVTKDFGDFTISYPSSMKLDPVAEFSDDFRVITRFYEGVAQDHLVIKWANKQETFDADYVATKYEKYLDS